MRRQDRQRKAEDREMGTGKAATASWSDAIKTRPPPEQVPAASLSPILAPPLVWSKIALDLERSCAARKHAHFLVLLPDMFLTPAPARHQHQPTTT